MPESQGAATVSPWAKPWMENPHRHDTRSIFRRHDVEEKWSRRRTLLFVVTISLTLWVLIVSSILLIL
jgi:hypothetical protein